ncbi:MAG: lamin tail domain-containing protein [Archangium sp.]|nr:lamin tail domain-containing protein [Archangium sp.]
MRILLVVAVASLSLISLMNCGMPMPTTCTSGTCSDAGLVINELAGTGADFVELFNATDSEMDLSGFGLTDMDDAGIRYATALRFGNGTTIAARGYFTVLLESDCPTTVTPCVRGEFGISQGNGDTLTLLDAQNGTVAQQAYPANAASTGSSWARTYDGAPMFEVQRRSPGAKNAP